MYKKAFNCRQYKGENAQPCDCPAWMGIEEMNMQSGETRRRSDCSFKLMPQLMLEVVKASNRPAAAVEDTRNQIVQGFAVLHKMQEKAIQKALANDDRQG